MFMGNAISSCGCDGSLGDLLCAVVSVPCRHVCNVTTSVTFHLCLPTPSWVALPFAYAASASALVFYTTTLAGCEP